MKTRNAVVGAFAVAALSTFLSAGQVHAQNFTFTSIFADNTITSGTSTLSILNSNSVGVIGAPTAIVLSNLSEFTTPGTGPNAFVNSPYSTTLTIFDVASGTSLSHDFTGVFNGQADGGDLLGNGKSAFFTESPTTTSQQYVFATGTYTVTRSSFVSPGPQGNADGSQGAIVTFQPSSTVPEPGTVAAIIMGGAMLGLMAFRRRSTFTLGA
ncbi:MAG: PEP-CTERM sorting domain-containing protein [Capsulimonas sp.]|uniref:PEP-CTERM sorting domain-containing protein n=1 Tax=Capsulimonas sp. TaxID=2494211 RepID=UPI0032643006